jgi:hypothetical protein
LRQQNQAWKSSSQSQSNAYRSPQGYKPPHYNTAAVASPGSITNLNTLAEQFQKFLSLQPQAMATSSIGQLPHSSSDMSHSEWILDSGASHHMSPDSSSFTSVSPLFYIPVMTADDTPMPLAGIGSIVTPHLSLHNVYLIPKLKLNLESVGQICDSGDYLVMFSGSFYCVQDLQSQKLIGTGRRENGLYILDELKVPVVVAAAATTTVDLSSFRLSLSSSSFYLWHSHLGHVSSSHLRFLASTGALGNLKTYDISDCSGCKLAKFSALPFNRSISVSSSPFDLIHSDVWGPPVATKGGSRYYVSFIDDHTRYCWVYLMKHHSEFFEIYAVFRALIKTQHSTVIKCFRCDLGGEYISNKFYQLLTLDGTIHQTSCTDILEQNGVAERKHGHIIETVCSLLLFAFVPSEFWREVILTAVSLINTIPSSHSSSLSPFEKVIWVCP